MYVSFLSHITSQYWNFYMLQWSLIIDILIVLQTGTTALFFAAQGGFLDIVQLLLDNNAPVNSASVVRIHQCTMRFIVLASVNVSRLCFVSGWRQSVICRVPVWTYGCSEGTCTARGGRKHAYEGNGTTIHTYIHTEHQHLCFSLLCMYKKKTGFTSLVTQSRCHVIK